MLWIALQGSDAQAQETLPRSPLSSVKALPEKALSWEEWKTARFSPSETDRGVHGDPDHDGIPNLCEYAFGSDPEKPTYGRTAETLDLFKPYLIGKTAGVRFELPENLPADLVYEVEQSPSLHQARWTTLATKAGASPWKGALGVDIAEDHVAPGHVRVTMRPEAVKQASGFFRLRLFLTTADGLTDGAELVPRERSLPKGTPLFVRSGSDRADWNGAVDFEVRRSGTLTASAALAKSVVWIPRGQTVVVADALTVKVLAVDGVLQVRSGARLQVETILIEDEGRLDIRGEDIEIGFAGSLVGDPSQSGVGIHALGQVSIEGTQQRPHFAMVAGAVAGSSLLKTDPALGWEVGDQLAFPDLQHWTGSKAELDGDPGLYRSQLEIRTVTAVTAEELRLDRPLEYDHRVGESAPVAHLTRPIRLRTSAASSVRAHALFAGETRVVGAEFVDMGRTTAEEIDGLTNPAGRYPCHLLESPGFELTNVTVHASSQTGAGSPRHGIVHHGGSGTIRDCVVVGAQSSGILLQDQAGLGEWTGNVVFPAGSWSHYRSDADRFVSHGGRELGSAPFGFWLRGQGVALRDCRVYGFGLSAFASFLERETGRRGAGSRYLLRSFDACEALGTFLDGPVTLAYCPSAEHLTSLDIDGDLVPERRRPLGRATIDGDATREEGVAPASLPSATGGPWARGIVRVTRPNESTETQEAADTATSHSIAGIQLSRPGERELETSDPIVFEVTRSGDLTTVAKQIERAHVVIPSGREAVIRADISVGRLTVRGLLRIEEGTCLIADAVVVEVGGILTVEGRGADALLGHGMGNDSSPYEGLAGVVSEETLSLLDPEPFAVTQEVWELVFRDTDKSGIRSLRHSGAGRRTARGAVIERSSLRRPAAS